MPFSLTTDIRRAVRHQSRQQTYYAQGVSDCGLSRRGGSRNTYSSNPTVGECTARDSPRTIGQRAFRWFPPKYEKVAIGSITAYPAGVTAVSGSSPTGRLVLKHHGWPNLRSRDDGRLSRIVSRPISSRPYGTGRPLKSNPGLASWAKFSKFSRPSGTEFGNGVLPQTLKPPRLYQLSCYSPLGATRIRLEPQNTLVSLKGSQAIGFDSCFGKDPFLLRW
jgi:hypothetical protein